MMVSCTRYAPHRKLHTACCNLIITIKQWPCQQCAVAINEMVTEHVYLLCYLRGNDTFSDSRDSLFIGTDWSTFFIFLSLSLSFSFFVFCQRYQRWSRSFQRTSPLWGFERFWKSSKRSAINFSVEKSNTPNLFLLQLGQFLTKVELWKWKFVKGYEPFLNFPSISSRGLIIK